MFPQITIRAWKLPVWLAGLMVSVGLLSGCGQSMPRGKLPSGSLTITITYSDKPVTIGHLDLSNSQTGEGGGVDLNNQGIASLPRIVEGSYIVTVLPPYPNPTVTEREQSPSPETQYENIPKRFRSIVTSPLKIEVKHGELSEYHFDLKDVKQIQSDVLPPDSQAKEKG